MTEKIVLWLFWIGFITYVLLLAPPLHVEETLALLRNILTLHWAEINPIILSLFGLVGIWLLIYSGILFFDGRMQWIPFWPFALASVASGILGLLPYLALRSPNQKFSGDKDTFLNLLDSRFFGVALSFTTICLLAYALFFGHWGDFWQQFQRDRFIHGMSLAFYLFCLLFPTILGDDMARRGWSSSVVFWSVSLIPLLGSLVYMSLRVPLQDHTNQVPEAPVNRFS
ncbi:MAG: hypothetical protein PUP91_30040 [Rhizonema sp. PD37]|nr:hypothetical protein [Rhizonema sp. PD37]